LIQIVLEGLLRSAFGGKSPYVEVKATVRNRYLLHVGQIAQGENDAVGFSLGDILPDNNPPSPLFLGREAARPEEKDDDNPDPRHRRRSRRGANPVA
jgi:hypothetical protein